MSNNTKSIYFSPRHRIRNISKLILWGSVTWMPKLEASYFVEFSSTLLHPVFAHEEYHVLQLWQENDGNDTVFTSSHFIKWFMISVCPNIDDIHLNHLIKVVAVKFLHCQVTLPYVVIKTFFCILKYIHILFPPKFRFINLIKSIWLIASYFTKGIMTCHYHYLYWYSYCSSLRQWEPP